MLTSGIIPLKTPIAQVFVFQTPAAGERLLNELWEDKNIWSHVARTWVLEYLTRAEEAE